VRRALGLALGVAVAVTAAACKDSPTAPSVPEGTYALTRVDNNAVPFTYASFEEYRQELTSGTLELRLDSTFVARTTTTDYIPGVSPQAYVDSVYGRWRRTENTIHFTDAFDGSTLVALWAGDEISFSQALAGATRALVFSR
jgi:hypothetical protein